VHALCASVHNEPAKHGNVNVYMDSTPARIGHVSGSWYTCYKLCGDEATTAECMRPARVCLRNGDMVESYTDTLLSTGGSWYAKRERYVRYTLDQFENVENSIKLQVYYV